LRGGTIFKPHSQEKQTAPDLNLKEKKAYTSSPALKRGRLLEKDHQKQGVKKKTLFSQRKEIKGGLVQMVLTCEGENFGLYFRVLSTSTSREETARGFWEYAAVGKDGLGTFCSRKKVFLSLLFQRGRRKRPMNRCPQGEKKGAR